MALGVRGYSSGRIVEVFDAGSAGKTTLALHAAAQVQDHGGIAAFLDADHRLHVDDAGKLGVRLQELLVSQPDTGERALEIATHLVRSGAVDLVVVDSISAVVLRTARDLDDRTSIPNAAAATVELVSEVVGRCSTRGLRSSVASANAPKSRTTNEAPPSSLSRKSARWPTGRPIEGLSPASFGCSDKCRARRTRDPGGWARSGNRFPGVWPSQIRPPVGASLPSPGDQRARPPPRGILRRT